MSADLPLRDEVVPEPARPIEREMFATHGRAEPAMPPPRRHSGLSLWLAAAAALVAGIVIGFASGYTAAQRSTDTADVTSSAPPGSPEGGTGTTSSQTFTEDAVPEPVRVDPEPIVTPPEPAAPAPDPVAPAPAPPRRPAPAVDTARSAPPRQDAAGPGSLQVVSRPAGAQVVLDGRTIGQTPLVIPDVRTGTHSIRLDLPGFQRWATSVEVTPGQQTRVAASLEQ